MADFRIELERLSESPKHFDFECCYASNRNAMLEMIQEQYDERKAI